MIPSPTWLNSGDNAWQLTAATLVGIMSIPGLAILYGGIVKRRWAVNSALMVVSAFSMTRPVGTLFAYNRAFGRQWFPGHGHMSDLTGKPSSVLGAGSLLGQ